MSTFTIQLNEESGTFDSQYPIFLQDHQISPQQFHQTLQGLNTLAQPQLLELATKPRRRLLLSTVLASVIGCSVEFALIYLFIKFLGTRYIGIVVGFSVFAMLLGILIPSMMIKKKVEKMHENVRNSINNYLQYQNAQIYYPARVQIILRNYNSSMGFGKYRISNSVMSAGAPFLEFYTCVQPVDVQQILQTNQQPLLQQPPQQQYVPSYQQQQGLLNEYYQQPHHLHYQQQPQPALQMYIPYQQQPQQPLPQYVPYQQQQQQHIPLYQQQQPHPQQPLPQQKINPDSKE